MINGVTKTQMEWSKVSGLPSYIIYQRVSKGITGDDLLLPVHKTRIKL